MNPLQNVGAPLIRGLLAVVGFGALTGAFIVGRVSTETYVPLVALMVGFFFNGVKTDDKPKPPTS